MKKYANFSSNLAALHRLGDRDLSDEYIWGGLLFKFTQQVDLTWKLLKEILAYEGIPDSQTGSPRQIFKAAYAAFDFLEDETVWLSMLSARNSVTHIYDEQMAHSLIQTFLEDYLPEIDRLHESIIQRYGEEFLTQH